MRTKLGVAVALSLAGAVLITGFPAAATTPTESTDPTTTSTTTTTTTSTTTTTTTTTIPGAYEVPGVAGRVADRVPGQLQLTEPPPAPTTTTTAPPIPPWVLPANSGEGRRVVYSKTNQWVWTVEADGRISKDHAVSGRRTWNQPLPGEYRVFSRSQFTCNITNRSVCWRYMVRFTVGPDGDNIGFHEIPTNTETGRPLQGEWQLGRPLSNGCIRQATPDALHIWNWAPVGTKVVVLP